MQNITDSHLKNKKILGLSRNFWREFRILLTLIIIALTIKATIVEIYVVPTGSMEDTILTGDMLVGNKFIYGLRTPKQISLIWTRMGFSIPWVRLPKFKEVETGDVVIFEFPRDPFQKYVKRCIGTPNDKVEIKQGDIIINDQKMEFPVEGKFTKDQFFPPDKDQTIFPYFTGNQDNIQSFTVPYQGMNIEFSEVTDWVSTITLLLQDGNEVTLGDRSFTLIDPSELARMVGFLKYKLLEILKPSSKNKIRSDQLTAQRNYMSKVIQENHSNNIYNPWEIRFRDSDHDLVMSHLKINDVSLSELKSYTLKHNFYFFMGDNRDNSSDSRFWGFVPDHQILGTPLFSVVNLMKFKFRLRFVS